jgi:hypothetical protein
MPNDSAQFAPRVDYMAESTPAQIRIRDSLSEVVLELVPCAAALLILMFCAIASSSAFAQDQKLSEQPTTAQPVEQKSPSPTPANFSGEYADQNFLNGQAVFQMSLQQSGDTVSVWFSASYNDGHGAAPEADGTGKVTDKGTVQFKFKDSSKNAGTGRIAPAGESIIVSFKTKHVSDSSGREFYGQKMRLKRMGKK